MEAKNIKYVVTLHLVAFTSNFLVCFWDINALNAASWVYYYPFKILSLGYLLVNAILVIKKKIDPQLAYDLSCINVFLYGYIGTKYIHPTYIFTFYELMVMNCMVSTNTVRRFSMLTLFALVLNFLSIHEMPEPDFIKEGFSIKGHLYVVTLIYAFLTTAVYVFFNRQKEMIIQMNERFSMVGRQATFLLHELKGPLSRFLANSSRESDKEGEHIYSIISGVESLVRSPDNYKNEFVDFDWEHVQEHLESEFLETCQVLGIEFEITGMNGKGRGQLTTLKLAIRNLVKNAIDAISYGPEAGAVRIKKDGNTILISNTGKKISSSAAKSFFTPFQSTKSSPSNLGVGLHFVEHVINAHGGSIMFDVNDEEGWNTFKVIL